MTSPTAIDAVTTDLNADSSPILKRGISAAQAGDRPLARTLLVHVTESDPQCVDAWLWLASISEYPEELLGFLNKILEIEPNHQRATTWKNATCSLLAKSHVSRAFDALSEGKPELAIRIEHKIHLAKIDASAGDFDAAESSLTDLLAAQPENTEAWVLLAHLARSFDAKLEAYNNLLQIDPSNAFARYGYDFLTGIAESVKTLKVVDARPEADEEDLTALMPDLTEQDEVRFGGDAADLNGEPTKYFDHVEEISEQLSAFVFDEVEIANRDTAEALDPFTEIADDEANGNAAEAIAFETASYASPFAETRECRIDDYEIEEVRVRDKDDLSIHETEAAPLRYEPATQPWADACPFCDTCIDAQVFSCSGCQAVLTLSDIESMLANDSADNDAIQQAVTIMEADWNTREFNAAELRMLGIGCLNLKNYDLGLAYIQEASRQEPNDVILSGQVNALAIRIDEIRRHDEQIDSLPKGKTILVVDDSATVRKLIANKLEKSGHQVICAVDGVEAMALIEQSTPDLVLLDIAMPRMDGYQVCKLIRSHDVAKDVPVVMISGKDGFFDKVRGRMAGTTGYITKPFGPETLMKALETYLVPENQVAE